MIYFFAGSEAASSSWDECRRELAALGISSEAISYDASTWVEGYDAAIAGLESQILPGAVLVGHSLAGLFLPVLGEKTMALAEIYIAALVPQPQASFTEQVFSDGTDVFTAEWSKLYGSPASGARVAMRNLLFGDCPPGSDNTHYKSMHNLTALYDLPCPLPKLPRRERTYLACTRDRTIELAWQRHAARKWLGVEAIDLDAGHLPQISMPKELALRLARLTRMKGTIAGS